jgi:acyl-CoA thioesterase YciA
MNGAAGDVRVAMERHGTVSAGPPREAAAAPRGGLASRTLAMPADTNPRGDIFGGWLMALMDSAGKMTATERADGRVVTVAVSGIAFLRPVQVGDTVCCYTQLTHVGRTSLALDVEVWVLRQGKGERIKVTEAGFTFVAVDEQARPRPLPVDNGRGGLAQPTARAGDDDDLAVDVL